MGTTRRRVAVVGGGFAGIDVARGLVEALPEGWEVVLYSRENHFVFTPLLSEVVSASVTPLHVVWPLRQMARGAIVRTAEVVEVDVRARQIVHRGPAGLEREGYDELVLCPGLDARLDLVPGLSESAHPLKTLADAISLRNRLILQLERAEATHSDRERARLLSVCVIGGGFTGVETAASIAELFARCSRYYPSLATSSSRLTLVNRGDALLQQLPARLTGAAHRSLDERGIDVRLGVGVERLDPDGLHLDDGSVIEAGLVVSAAGSEPTALVSNSDLPIERGRIRVTPEMVVSGLDGVWALGDCAAVPNARDGRVSPPLAQFATRQATQLVRNVAGSIAGRPAAPFRYRSQGMFASLGHHDAVGQAFGLKVSGVPASILWHGIYWGKMPSVPRRVQIALDWAWSAIFPWAPVAIAGPPARRLSGPDEPAERS